MPLIRIKKDALKNLRRITIDGVIPAKDFSKDVPTELTEEQWKALQKGYSNSDIFEVVKGESLSDVKEPETEPRQGIVKEKDKKFTKDEAYGLLRNEQIKLLKDRGIEDIGKIEDERVDQILRSNPK